MVMMTAAAYGDFRGRRWQQMTMALIDNGTRELAADGDGKGTRPGGEQRRHLALIISGNNSKIKLLVILLLGKVVLAPNQTGEEYGFLNRWREECPRKAENRVEL